MDKVSKKDYPYVLYDERNGKEIGYSSKWFADGEVLRASYVIYPDGTKALPDEAIDTPVKFIKQKKR